jgi:mannose-6-phosphate isomerase-like protein (cupin superfamily)
MLPSDPAPLPEPQVFAFDRAAVLTRGQTGLNAQIRDLVSPDACGSGFRFGVAQLEAGEEAKWSFEERDDTAEDEAFLGTCESAYFCLQGKLRLNWGDGQSVDLRPDQALYVAPGRRYRLQSLGDETARIVFVTTGYAPPEQRERARRPLRAPS